jgi:hypothetical protein
MRYISVYDRLKLYDYSGNLRYSFYNKELIVGSPTDPNAVIDASTQTPFENTLMRVYNTTLTNSANSLLELCGLGYLDTPANYRLFFEAPYLTSLNVTTPGRYRVEKGTVTVNGTTYYPGQIINAQSGDVINATTGSFFAPWLPSALDRIECGGSWSPTEQFLINNLLTGNEPAQFWTYSLGFSGRNSTDPNDPAFVGWIENP